MQARSLLRTLEEILGSDILQQFEITFDLRNNTIFLKPDTEFKRDPYRYVTGGIQIAKNDQGSFQIMSVWKDSPAARAGLQQRVGIDFVLHVPRSPGLTAGS